MRRVVSLMNVSLDGFVAGPDGSMDFVVMNPEMFKDVNDAIIDSVDVAIYGPATYGMMAGYWPTVPSNPDSSPEDVRHAHWVEAVEKVVFSRTLDKVEWNNARLVKSDIAAEIARLKSLPGKDLMIFGSPRLTHAFMKLGLIDAYQINISPAIVGAGIPMFADVKTPEKLKLLRSKTYDVGAIALHYEVIRCANC
jgi:dihydrofolate reductase